MPERADFITGLRDLADALEFYEDLPVPRNVIISPLVTGKDAIPNLRAIAEQLPDAQARAEDGIASVEARFGPVFYVPWGTPTPSGAPT